MEAANWSLGRGKRAADLADLADHSITGEFVRMVSGDRIEIPLLGSRCALSHWTVGCLFRCPSETLPFLRQKTT
jgi:hypothetical protein